MERKRKHEKRLTNRQTDRVSEQERDKNPFICYHSLSSQMFEHSQALHAHQQQRQSHPGHSALAGRSQPGSTSSSSHRSSTQRVTVAQESSFNPSASQQVPVYQRQHSSGGGITQQQLASALAGAMGTSTAQSSHLSAADLSTARASR